MASPVRLSHSLIREAEKEGDVKRRTVPKQIEFWAELGKAVERVISPAEAYAVIQGLKQIKTEPVPNVKADPNEVFKDLEKKRKQNMLSSEVTSSRYIYEASPEHPGLLTRVDSETGKRQTGSFKNGKFKVLK
jgi:hypothetical protein